MSGWVWTALGALLVAAVLVTVTRAFWRRRAEEVGGMPRILDEGWQFYSRPTTLEPPGTVFRIDGDGRRYIVDELDVEIGRGAEASGRHDEVVTTALGVVARFLGLGAGARLAGRRLQHVEFEIHSPEREVTTDAAIEGAVDALADRLGYRADNRYFVVREARRAAGLTYRLTDEQVDELGGDATLEGLAEQSAELALRRRGRYEIDQRFAEAMRVMFLADEIKPVSAALAGEQPELGVVPVREVLVWEREGE